MSLLLDLPEVQQIAILTEWLKFVCVGRFYTALCNKALRVEFSRLTSTNYCIFDILESMHKHKVSNVWIAKNGFKVREAELRRRDLKIKRIRQPILKHLGATLETVKIKFTTMVSLSNATQAENAVHVSSNVDMIKVLHNVSTLCPRVKHLQLAQSHSQHNLQCPGLLECIGDYIKYMNIAVLTLYSVQGISNEFLLALAGTPSLREVTLISCAYVMGMTPFEKYAPNNNVQKFTVFTYVRLASLFPQLVELRVNTVLGTEFAKLQGEWPHLRTVKLGGGGQISSAIVATIARCGPNITELDVSFCKHEESLLLEIIDRFPALTSLRALRWCPSVVEVDAMTLLPTSHVGSRLRTVCINCVHASTLRAIVAKCSHLHTLILSNIALSEEETFPGEVERTLPCLASLTHLKVLTLRGYAHLSDTDILALQDLPLTHLSITVARHLTDECVLQLARALPLHTLALWACDRITHKLVLQVSDLCPTLRALTLR